MGMRLNRQCDGPHYCVPWPSSRPLSRKPPSTLHPRRPKTACARQTLRTSSSLPPAHHEPAHTLVEASAISVSHACLHGHHAPRPRHLRHRFPGSRQDDAGKLDPARATWPPHCSHRERVRCAHSSPSSQTSVPLMSFVPPGPHFTPYIFGALRWKIETFIKYK
jgi:hypothetical protein